MVKRGHVVVTAVFGISDGNGSPRTAGLIPDCQGSQFQQPYTSRAARRLAAAPNQLAALMVHHEINC
jgi:hypothetical protein